MPDCPDFRVVNGRAHGYHDSPSFAARMLLSPKRPQSRFATLMMAGTLALCLGTPAVRAAPTARCLLADGFDFPVGKPEADGYYKSRGYTSNGHLGEDWNGRGGGDSDYGDPIYAAARGVVVISENVHVGWGNCIIVRTAYREKDGSIQMVDSLYAHLNERKVAVGQLVERGQVVGTMGGNSGMYPVHLHFEMRKNLQIGMNRQQFARDSSNYYSPTDFINRHRTLSADFAKVDIPMRGFADYGQSLTSADSAPVIKPTSRGYRIPVYRGDGSTGAGTASSVKAPDPMSRIKADTKSRTPAAPAPTPTEPSDFWSKMKSKLKGGQMVSPGTTK